jgi:hypothetical protein
MKPSVEPSPTGRMEMEMGRSARQPPPAHDGKVVTYQRSPPSIARVSGRGVV